MIQANELRIGNLIYYKFDPKDWENIELCLNDFKILEAGYSERYRPIPITKEWLIDLGFEDIGSHEYLIDYVFILENEYTDAGLWNVCFGDSYITEIKYIHELQNLYFVIIGKELTKQKP